MANQIEKTYIIDAPIEKVWDALTDPKEIEKWGGGTAKMSANKGDFSLWDGDIWGKNIEIKAPNYLKQEWYGGKWPEPSIVEFFINEEIDQTELKLIQNGVPENEKKDIDSGWDGYYLGAIKYYLESK